MGEIYYQGHALSEHWYTQQNSRSNMINAYWEERIKNNGNAYLRDQGDKKYYLAGGSYGSNMDSKAENFTALPIYYKTGNSYSQFYLMKPNGTPLPFERYFIDSGTNSWSESEFQNLLNTKSEGNTNVASRRSFVVVLQGGGGGGGGGALWRFGNDDFGGQGGQGGAFGIFYFSNPHYGDVKIVAGGGGAGGRPGDRGFGADSGEDGSNGSDSSFILMNSNDTTAYGGYRGAGGKANDSKPWQQSNRIESTREIVRGLADSVMWSTRTTKGGFSAAGNNAASYRTSENSASPVSTLSPGKTTLGDSILTSINYAFFDTSSVTSSYHSGSDSKGDNNVGAGGGGGPTMYGKGGIPGRDGQHSWANGWGTGGCGSSARSTGAYWGGDGRTGFGIICF